MISTSLDKVAPLTNNIGLRKWTQQVWPPEQFIQAQNNLALALVLMFSDPPIVYLLHMSPVCCNDLSVRIDQMRPLYWV